MESYYVIRDYGDGYTDAEVRQIADAEATAIRRNFPRVDVVVVSADDPRAVRHDGEQADEINRYLSRVWSGISESYPFNGGPDADVVVEALRREGRP
jgi:hypothetical protein